MKKEKLAPPPPAPRWTRIEDYLAEQRARSAQRRLRSARPAREAEPPRLMWSVVPFIALLAALAVIATAIIVIAYPGRERSAETPRTEAATGERGTAPAGWYEDARREMR